TPGAHPALRTLRRSGGFREVAAFGDEKAPEVRIFAVTPEQAGGGAPQPAGGVRGIDAEPAELGYAGPEALPPLDAADRAGARTRCARAPPAARAAAPPPARRPPPTRPPGTTTTPATRPARIPKSEPPRPPPGGPTLRGITR